MLSIKRRPWSIGTLITMFLTSMVILTTIVLTLLNVQREERDFNQNLQQQARLLLATIIRTEADKFYTLNVSEIEDTLDSISETEFLVSARAYDAKGSIIADTSGLTQVPSLQIDPLGTRILTSADVLFENLPDNLIAGQVVQAGNQRIGAVSIILSKRDLAANIAGIRIRGLFVGLIVSMLGVSLSAAISRAITRPVSALSRAAERMARGDLEHDIKVAGIKELMDLAGLFNIMRSHLQALLRELNEEAESLAKYSKKLELVSQVNQRRAKQFEAISQIGSTIISIRSLDELLSKITQTISEQFGYYHVGIFFVDPLNQYAILRAANSEGGRRMLARGHQLKIGAQGIVGYVTSEAKPRIALNVGKDSVYYNNPDLPATQSEMALPLFAGDLVLGALDIQSAEANAFTHDDIEVLSVLADQVSLAIENSRLFEQTQKTLAEAEVISRVNIRESWSRLPHEQKLFGYKYSIIGAAPLEEFDEINLHNPFKNEIALPINLRGETIGTLTVKVPTNERISTDQVDLIKAVAERVAISAENARLFDETQKRAERERVITEITSKIGSSVRTENILKTTARELNQFLDGAEVLINLKREK